MVIFSTANAIISGKKYIWEKFQFLIWKQIKLKHIRFIIVQMKSQPTINVTLSNHTQFVNINGAKSDFHNISCGVPQGSVLGPILYLLRILWMHNLFIFYADDSQLYTTFTHSNDVDHDITIQRIATCMVDIKNWMTLNKLKLNSDKTDLVIFYPTHRQPPKQSAVSVGSEIIKPANSIKNFSVIFDKCMTMLPHVNSVCKSAFYHIRNISRIRKLLTTESTEILVHVFVRSHLDYCNSVLYGSPKYILQKLQRAQNATARLIKLSSKYEHVTPHLMDFTSPNGLISPVIWLSISLFISAIPLPKSPP